MKLVLGQALENLRKVQPACVFVESEDEIGSGVCISVIDSLILTAGHCAGELGSIRTVEFPCGKVCPSTCTATSQDYDLALLTLDCPLDSKSDFICPTFATHSAKKTDNIVIIGQPGIKRGPRQQVALGQVTSVCRDPLANQLDKGGLGHNAFTYFGHSGSPVFNYRGEIIGLHTTCVVKGEERGAVLRIYDY